jgi:hypothetical protein
MRDGKGGLLTVTKSVSHMFVPLPMRVYLSANDADEVARDYLANAADFLWPLLMDRVSTQLGQAAAGEVQEFMELVRTGRLVRRTYLTSAARYRHHLAQSGLVAEATQEALLRTLPHFVWVTELMRPTSAQVGQDGPREILGHTIINATSSTDSDLDLLLVHAPHLLLHRDINPEADAGVDFEEELLLLGEDHPYRGRLRR